jgi:transposase
MFIMGDKINAKQFLQAMYKIKSRFNKIILILDSAPWHRKSKKVQAYFKNNRREIKVIWLPRGCPEMNPVEECWRQAKQEVNGGRVHKNFNIMKKELKHFLRYNKFKQDVGRYLCP